jgi:hypothetical protein
MPTRIAGRHFPWTASELEAEAEDEDEEENEEDWLRTAMGGFLIPATMTHGRTRSGGLAKRLVHGNMRGWQS